MLEKSLPFFRQQKSQDQNQNKSKEKKVTPYSESPNLIFYQEHPRYYSYPLAVMTRFFIRTYFFIAIVFGLMLIANWALNLKLQSQKILLNNMADQVSKYSVTRTVAGQVDAKTKFYQKTLSERVTLGNKTNLVFSGIDSTVTVDSIQIEATKFTMDFTVQSPIYFALLVDRYLQSDSIAEINLKSAELVPAKGIFKVKIEGIFK